MRHVQLFLSPLKTLSLSSHRLSLLSLSSSQRFLHRFYSKPLYTPLQIHLFRPNSLQKDKKPFSEEEDIIRKIKTLEELGDRRTWAETVGCVVDFFKGETFPLGSLKLLCFLKTLLEAFGGISVRSWVFRVGVETASFEGEEAFQAVASNVLHFLWSILGMEQKKKLEVLCK